MQLVYSSSSLLLWLSADKEVLHLAWQPGVTTQGFYQGITAAVALTHFHALRGWVTDNEHVYPLTPPLQLWLQEHALLPLSNSSLQRVAIVLPAAAWPALAPESLIRMSGALVAYQIEYFASLPPACHWVQEGKTETPQ